MPFKFSAGGAGNPLLGAFSPSATDAFSALLARMPQYADQAFGRKLRKTDQDYAIAEEERGARKEARTEGIRGIRKAEEAGARAETKAEQEKHAGAMREQGDELAYISEAQQRARRYGGNPNEAAVGARTRFRKMTLGVPGAY